MDLHARQQFDFLLLTAAERFVERLEQRNEGPSPALARLRRDPQGEGVWLDQFVAAIFGDFLLDNPAGSCFVLEALARRPPPAIAPGVTIEATLAALARAAFADLLRSKADELLEHRT